MSDEREAAELERLGAERERLGADVAALPDWRRSNALPWDCYRACDPTVRVAHPSKGVMNVVDEGRFAHP